MARLPNQADGWAPPSGFVRLRWDHETFFGDVMVYGETAAGCWALPPAEVRIRFESVEARMTEVMGSADDWGLIHADLHRGNALFHRGGVKLIDFDDCGYGCRLYELAVAVWEMRDEQDYPAFRDALPAFDLWFTGMAQVNPAMASKLDALHRWSLSMLDRVEGTPEEATCRGPTSRY